MRTALAISVLLAVVATAMVAVCEHTEVCRLRYRLWEVERRRDSLERQLRELDAAIAENETPRALLEGDREAPATRSGQEQKSRERSPSGSRDLRWFEEMDR